MLLEGLILFILSFPVEVKFAKTDSGFLKTVYGGYLIVLVEYLSNRSPKMRKNKT